MATRRWRRLSSTPKRCERCGTEYYPRQRDWARSRFCSRPCANGRSGAANGNWKGGVSANKYRYKKRQIERHPEAVAAHKAVAKAIRQGVLTRQPCEVCRKPNAHAHHDDYSKPLDVNWLCRKHHRERHDAIGRPMGHHRKLPAQTEAA